MALVMLPCDLPWWHSVQKQLKKICTTKNTMEIIEIMQRIHDMCNISLDPDDDLPEPQQFTGLLNFLDNDLTSSERSNFLNKTLPCMATRASNLKMWKPKRGLHFSLQQQSDCNELEYELVSSLLANAFFSTFPKRTDKTHPTLQNFNFSYFFKHLNANSQKAKLRGVLYYFDWLDDGGSCNGTVKVMRQVMSAREWLTIEDWLECNLPLCPLSIKHEGRLDRSPPDALQVCFASTKVGGAALADGNSQMLCTLLHVELLEDNEVLTVERVRRVARVQDPRGRAAVERLDEPEEVTMCCIDAEDYSKLPLTQFEEDNVLRELNKCLLAYQQKSTVKPEPAAPNINRARRLSPIGESVSLGSNKETNTKQGIPIITQDSCSTNRSESPFMPRKKALSNNNLKVQLEVQRGPRFTTNENTLNNRRGRFIVLGSSGECLPVKRSPLPTEHLESLYSSVDSSEEEFHSAKTSVEDEGSEADEDFDKRYSLELETAERRHTFAERLREALRREASSLTTSTESSYAVGIAVAGARLDDKDIKVRRGGSTGFALQEDSLDEDILKDSLKQEQQWIDKFKNKQTALSRKSSEYSFSTDYSSELEEVYEQFSRWLEDPILETERGTKKQLDGRDLAVVQFAGAILKRTLSESFAGVSLTEGCENPTKASITEPKDRKKMVLNAKSLSLELARHKHRLAAQLSESVAPIAEELGLGDDGEETVGVKSESEPVTEVPEAGAAVSAPPATAVAGSEGKKRLNWVATCVTSVVQTLEDVCVQVSMPGKAAVITNSKLSQIAQKPKDGLRPVSTGNWGCGSSKRGDVQLKVVIQWLAASVSGVPALIYYTFGHPELASLDTVYRILRDRRWTVKDLVEATLRYSASTIEGRNDGSTLFEDLIGVERNSA